MLPFKDFILELSKPSEIDKFKKSVSGFNTVDTRDSSWGKDLPQLMKTHGFSKLGSGKYASVWGNDKYPYVIKVFMKDSAYLKWISFALANKDNPYVPKVRGKVLKISPVIYAIRLEKLIPYSGNGGQFMKDYYKWQGNDSYKSSDDNIQKVLDHFKTNSKLLDLHGENMMMRGNQLVIVDPYYNWFNKTKKMDYTIDPNDIDPALF